VSKKSSEQIKDGEKLRVEWTTSNLQSRREEKKKNCLAKKKATLLRYCYCATWWHGRFVPLTSFCLQHHCITFLVGSSAVNIDVQIEAYPPIYFLWHLDVLSFSSSFVPH